VTAPPVRPAARWLYLTYPLNALLLAAVPAACAAALAQACGVSWSLFGAGALVFLAARAVRRPLDAGLARWSGRALGGTALGLTAALTEEGARYAALRWALPGARGWPEVLMVGAGHAGIEALLLAVTAALTFAQMVSLRHATGVPRGLSPDRWPALRARQAAYWAVPPAQPLLGAAERVLALAVHLAGAFLALQAVVRASLAWLGAAVVLHAAVDAGALALARQARRRRDARRRDAGRGSGPAASPPRAA
jgi:uncharacterized membrane protein YhfC